MEQVQAEQPPQAPDGYTCPLCGEEGQVAYEHGAITEGNEAWQTGRCLACGKGWHEVYTFSRVEAIESD